MRKGRPVRAVVRERIKMILLEGPKHGYGIYKEYKKRHGGVNLRLVYYHLKKGVALGEFVVHKIKEEGGEFTWGKKTERVYYAITAGV